MVSELKSRNDNSQVRRECFRPWHVGEFRKQDGWHLSCSMGSVTHACEGRANQPGHKVPACYSADRGAHVQFLFWRSRQIQSLPIPLLSEKLQASYTDVLALATLNNQCHQSSRPCANVGLSKCFLAFQHLCCPAFIHASNA